MSDSNRVAIRFCEEDGVYGTTPANATDWKDLRYTSSSLAAAPQTAISNEIRADRQVADLVGVGQSVTGDIGFELSATSFDELIEAACQGTWVANALKCQAVDRSFTFEMRPEDWATSKFLHFKGMKVGGMSITAAYGSIITGSFQLAGKSASVANATLVGSTASAAVPTTEVMNGSSGVTTISIGGDATIPVRTISLNLSNTMRAQEGIGQSGPTDQNSGRSMLTGSVEVYFDNITLYEALLNSTSVAISLTIAQGGKAFVFTLPKVKFNDGVPAVSGVDTDLMLPLNFTALYDATSATQMTITRIP